MWSENIVSTILPTREYKNESVQFTAKAPENPFKSIYVAHIAPHGPYGWTTGGHYYTQEEAEEEIRMQGWGGKVEKTTYYELNQVKI